MKRHRQGIDRQTKPRHRSALQGCAAAKPAIVRTCHGCAKNGEAKHRQSLAYHGTGIVSRAVDRRRHSTVGQWRSMDKLRSGIARPAERGHCMYMRGVGEAERSRAKQRRSPARFSVGNAKLRMAATRICEARQSQETRRQSCEQCAQLRQRGDAYRTATQRLRSASLS